MKRKQVIKPCTLLISLLLLPLLSACQESGERIYGVVERHSATLSAPASEKITQILKSEGDSITAGETLLQLDTIQTSFQIQQRKAELQQAEAQLSLLQNGYRPETREQAAATLAAAKARYQSALKTLKRTRELYRDKMVNDAELDTAETQTRVEKAQVESAQSKLNELKSGFRNEEIEQATAAVTAAKARLESAQYQLDQLTVKSEISGTVDQLPWQTGDRVGAGTLLASVLDNSKPYVRAYLPQNLLDKVTLGTELQLQSGEEPNQQYRGQIRMIHKQPAFTPFYALNEANRSRLMVLVDIDLLDQAKNLPTGLALEVILP